MVRVLIAGDYCPMGRIASLIEVDDYDVIFSQIKPFVEKADYSIVNLECPVCTSDNGGIKKAGPLLKCLPKGVNALKFVGFDCVTLANNHFYDQGETGVKETLQALDEARIEYVGGGRNIKDASKTLYHQVNDKTIAIINCCEHEFSIASETSGGSNPLNPVQQFYAIKEAKEKADFVLVIVHGGIEHYPYPSQRMIDTYRFFVDTGADAVINHHQHCFSGGEIWNGKPIFYGLGNFCFDWYERNSKLWSEGYMVELFFNNSDDVKFNLVPYIQNDVKPGIFLMGATEYKEWKTNYENISRVILDENKIEEKYKSLINKTERLYSSTITPYTGKIPVALYMHRLLPMLIPKRKLRVLLNMIMCESHSDRMIRMLRKYSR